MQVFLQRKGGKDVETVAAERIDAVAAVRLRVSADARAYSFYYGVGEGGWKALKMNDDGSILSTSVAGGFVGAVIGPYARVE